MTLRFKHIHEFGGLIIFKTPDKQSRPSFSLVGTHSREHWPGQGTDDTREPRTGKSRTDWKVQEHWTAKSGCSTGWGNSVIPLRAREGVGS